MNFQARLTRSAHVLHSWAIQLMSWQRHPSGPCWQLTSIATLCARRSTLHERKRSKTSASHQTHWSQGSTRTRKNACQAGRRSRSPPRALSKKWASEWEHSSPSSRHFCKVSTRETTSWHCAWTRPTSSRKSSAIARKSSTMPCSAINSSRSTRFRAWTRLVFSASWHLLPPNFHSRHWAPPTPTSSRLTYAHHMTSLSRWRTASALSPSRADIQERMRQYKWAASTGSADS